MRARAPLTLLTANQPMPAVTDCSPAGSTLPHQPNGTRLSTICETPSLGPRALSTPCERAPSPVPSASASTAWPSVRPKAATASTPTKMVANSRFGDVQVQNSCEGRPCRSSTGMNPAPPGSTAATRVP